MAVKSTQVTVTTTATELSAGREDYVETSRICVAVPTGGHTVYVGGAGVTSATGFPVAAGQSFADDLDGGEELYGIVASGDVSQVASVYQGGI